MKTYNKSLLFLQTLKYPDNICTLSKGKEYVVYHEDKDTYYVDVGVKVKDDTLIGIGKELENKTYKVVIKSN
jgi:hypothetical protein